MKNVFRAMLAVAMAMVPVTVAVVVPVCCYKMAESPIEYFVMGSLFGMALIIIAMGVDGLIGRARENKRKRAERLLVELCMKADKAVRAVHKDVVPRSEVEDIEADRNKYQNWWCQTNSELEKAKSEVDKLQNELIVWKQGRFNLYQRLELYKMAQEKVAREIEAFGEKVGKIYNHYVFEDTDYADDDVAIEAVINALTEVLNELDELKKKYTEEKE